MPLKKGSLFEAMSYMLPMLKGVAIWTKNFKIFNCIVFAITVFVMNTKNFLNLVIPASFTFFYKISSKHIFAHGLECRVPNFFFRLVNTRNAAKFSWFTWICKKQFSAVFAIARDRTLLALSFMIAGPATVFCCVRARRYMIKSTTTDTAICDNLHAGSYSFAGSGTILKTSKSVFRYVNKGFAMPAFHMFPSREF